MSRAPVISSKRLATSTGKGAAPERQMRMLLTFRFSIPGKLLKAT